MIVLLLMMLGAAAVAVPSTANGEQFLSPEELALYLKIPVATVYRWRTTGSGPPGRRVGRHVRYRLTDVDRWFDSQ